MNSGKGLGPWALALGGAWALALAWVFIGVGCQSMWLLFLCSASLRLPSQTRVPTQQHGCHPPPHTCSALYVMLLGAHCLGGLGSCVGEGVGARRAVGASSAPPPLLRPANECFAAELCSFPCPVRYMEAMSV